MLRFIKDVFKDFSEDKAMQLGAALSFYTLLSLAPLLMVVIGVAGLVFGRNQANQQIIGQIQLLVGQEGAQVARTILEHAARPSGSIAAIAVGIATLLFGATGVFAQLQSALNQIWDVQARAGLGIRGYIRTRLLSLAMVLGIGFLLLVSLVVSAGLAAVSARLSDLLPGMGAVWQVVNILVSLLVVTLLFAMIFKFLPDVHIAWSKVWFGAAVTGLLFTVGKTLIGFYLGHSSVGSVYGAAGSLVVLIVWVYYSSLIVFLGAEITQLYARRHGEAIQPSEHAVRVDDQLPPGRLAGAR